MKKSKETIKTYFETGDKPTQQQYENLVDSYLDNKQSEGEPNRRFVITNTGEVNIASKLKIPEYTLSNISGNKLTLLKDGEVVTEINLPSHTGGNNLVSGSVNTNGIATFTRSDNTKFAVDLSSLKNEKQNYQAGTNITIDNTNPQKPIINALGTDSINTNNLVPYSGAIQDVNLNNHNIIFGKQVNEPTNSYQSYIVDSDYNQELLKLVNRNYSKHNGSTNYNQLTSEKSSIGLGFNSLKNINFDRGNIGSSSITPSIALGHSSLENFIGQGAIAIGSNALNKGRSRIGPNVISIGNNSLAEAVISSGVYIGKNAGKKSKGDGTTTFSVDHAYNNVSIGNSNSYLPSDTIHGDIEGSHNVNLGDNSSTRKGNNNVSIGANSLGNKKIGSNIVSVGAFSLFNTKGENKVSVGYSSSMHDEGGNNTSLGYQANLNFIDDVSRKVIAHPDNGGFPRNPFLPDSDGFYQGERQAFRVDGGHNLGENGHILNLKLTYINGYTPSSKESEEGTITKFYIHDNEVIVPLSPMLGRSIIDQNVYEFTPQIILNNTTSLGANSKPTKSNQVVLGNNAISEVTTNGDYVCTGLGKGIILKTPDGTKEYRINIDNSGNLTTTLI